MGERTKDASTETMNKDNLIKSKVCEVLGVLSILTPDTRIEVLNGALTMLAVPLPFEIHERTVKA